MTEKISPHFFREEFACHCGCGFDAVDINLVGILEEAREYFNEPMTIMSGCRCESHNASVGGAKYSQHKLGKAADIVVKNVSPDKVADYFHKMYPHQYGLGRYNTFTHIDVRMGMARWDNRT